MTEYVDYHLKDNIGVITIDRPPVNALGQAVRVGLRRCLQQGLMDKNAKALIVIGKGKTFSAGADITEFGKGPKGLDLLSITNKLEAAYKPVVAAIQGYALGGGLEVALGCHYRIATASAKIGLPEVKLGILPGAGGTQRLPRLVGAEPALKIIVGGEDVSACKASDLGIIDELVKDEGLLPAALTYARRLVDENAPLRKTSEGNAQAGSEVFANFEKSIARRSRGFLAPFHCIKAVQAATELPFAAGCARERDLSAELKASPQSAAQQHIFFAERQVAKISGLGTNVSKRDINAISVIGAGTMGGGIAMNFLNAGIPVTLVDIKQQTLDYGVSVIRGNYDRSAKKGRITKQQIEQRMGLLAPTLDFSEVASSDLVIEAVFENMGLKKELFRKLDATCKIGTILVSNTSTLDLNEIASVTGRPQDIVGMHFFSPANVMRLVENIRGDKTANDVLVTVMDLCKRIGKIGVLVGVCFGFVGNRMLHKRRAEVVALVDEGASPQSIDNVLYEFGFPMGPLTMMDLAGLDVSYRIRQAQREADPINGPKRTWLDDLVEIGRLGQKTGAGVFDYVDGSRVPTPSGTTKALIDEYRKANGLQVRDVSHQEILERCLYVMVNEAAKILEEGIAKSPLDVDIIWTYGYGFPAYRGGILHWADSVGVKEIYRKVSRLHDVTGKENWKPATLLKQLASEGKGFSSLVR